MTSRVLYELMNSVDKARSFLVILAEDEEADFKAKLSADFQGMSAILEAVDVLKAKATHKDDKDMIMDMIKARDGGVQEFNKTIIEELQMWLEHTASMLLADNEEDTKLLAGVAKLTSECALQGNACFVWRGLTAV